MKENNIYEFDKQVKREMLAIMIFTISYYKKNKWHEISRFLRSRFRSKAHRMIREGRYPVDLVDKYEDIFKKYLVWDYENTTESMSLLISEGEK